MKKGVRIVLIVLAVIVILIAAAVVVMLALTKRSEAAFGKLVAEGPPHVEFIGIADGTYKGSYNILPVNVEVEVGVSDGKITSIDILKHVNGQGGPAEAIIDDVIEQQTCNVDTISGATYSSLVILKAIEDALVAKE